MFKNSFLVVALLSGSQAIFGFGCCKCWPKGEAPIAPEAVIGTLSPRTPEDVLSPRAQEELGNIIIGGAAADAADHSRFAHHPSYQTLRAMEIKTQENLAFAAAISRKGGKPSDEDIRRWQADSATAASLRAKIMSDLYPSSRK